jgi:hypothetical protein
VLDWGVEDVPAVRVSDVLLLWVRHRHTDNREKQTLKLETIGVHDRHSHIGGKMHVRKSAPGLGGFSRLENEASANDESGRWSSITASIKYPVS